MKKMRVLISLALALLTAMAHAQLGSNPLAEGNESYEQEKFDEAEVDYRKAIDKEEDFSPKAEFNLGDALYRQNRLDEAANQFAKVAEMTEDKDLKARALHNLGNTHVQNKKLKEAVEAYKQALKANPKAEETRRNLARTLRKLKQQQQQQNQNKEDQEQNQDQQQDQKKNQDQNKNQDQKEQQKQDQDQSGQKNEPQDQKENGDKSPQPRKDRISREDAERLLRSINADEQEVQKKINKEKLKGQPVNTEKDW